MQSCESADDRSVVRCGISQLPDQIWTELLGGMTDEIGPLIVVGGVEIGFRVVDDLAESPPLRNLVANPAAVRDGQASALAKL